MPSDEMLLRDPNARLDLPPHARVWVLREVRDDVEAMVEHLMEQGVSRQAAERRAMALLCPGEKAVMELAEVHLSPFRRLAARLGHAEASQVERATVIAMAGLAAAAWEVVPPSPQGLASWASQVANLLALTLGVAMLGIFGSLALMQALWRAQDLLRGRQLQEA